MDHVADRPRERMGSDSELSAYYRQLIEHIPHDRCTEHADQPGRFDGIRLDREAPAAEVIFGALNALWDGLTCADDRAVAWSLAWLGELIGYRPWQNDLPPWDMVGRWREWDDAASD